MTSAHHTETVQRLQEGWHPIPHLRRPRLGTAGLFVILQNRLLWRAPDDLFHAGHRCREVSRVRKAFLGCAQTCYQSTAAPFVRVSLFGLKQSIVISVYET